MKTILISVLVGMALEYCWLKYWWAKALAFAKAEEARAQAKLKSIFDPSKPPTA